MWETVFKWINRSADPVYLQELKAGLIDAWHGDFRYFGGEYVHISNWRMDWLLKQVDSRIEYLEHEHRTGLLHDLAGMIKELL